MSHATVTGVGVNQVSGPAFSIQVGAHRLLVDQPADAGGQDAGPTPTELFVASLAACTAHYAYAYLHHHGLPDTGIAVACGFEWSAGPPARVATIELELRLPDGLPEERRAAVLRAASRCAVHSSIEHGVEVNLHL